MIDAVHDPVIFLDNHGIQAHFAAEGFKQLFGFRQLVNESRHVPFPAGPGPKGGHSALGSD